MGPALAGIKLEEDAETVSEAGVILSDRVVPQQHQTGQHLGTGDSSIVHEFGKALCRFCTQLRHLKFWTQMIPSIFFFSFNLPAKRLLSKYSLVHYTAHLTVQELWKHHKDTLCCVFWRLLLSYWWCVLLSVWWLGGWGCLSGRCFREQLEAKQQQQVNDGPQSTESDLHLVQLGNLKHKNTLLVQAEGNVCLLGSVKPKILKHIVPFGPTYPSWSFFIHFLFTLQLYSLRPQLCGSAVSGKMLLLCLCKFQVFLKHVNLSFFHSWSGVPQIFAVWIAKSQSLQWKLFVHEKNRVSVFTLSEIFVACLYNYAN